MVATRQGSAPTLIVSSGDSSARSSPALVFSLLSGYVPPSRVYVRPSASFAMPRTVSRNPSAQEIAEAVALVVEDWLPNFPFVGGRRPRPRGRVLLAAVCCVAVRADHPRRSDAALPLLRAGAGTGKGLLQSELTSPAVGPCGAPPVAQPGDDDEMRKLITSMLLQDRTQFVLGNVSRVIDSAALSEAMTASV